jgi:hypothetical protein
MSAPPANPGFFSDATHIFEAARAAREHFQVRKTQALEPPGDGLKKLFEH